MHDASSLNHIIYVLQKKIIRVCFLYISGGVTDEDVDAVMRLGGPSCRPEITYEELPAALGIVMALKSENFQTKDLFDRHDVDKVYFTLAL